jgi:hypothetical protein
VSRALRAPRLAASICDLSHWLQRTDPTMKRIILGLVVVGAGGQIACGSSDAPSSNAENTGGAGVSSDAAAGGGGGSSGAGGGTSGAGGASGASGSSGSGGSAGSADSGAIVGECNVDGDCTGGNKRCVLHFCIECTGDSDCSGGQVCHFPPGDCTQACTQDSDCTGGAYPVCNATQGRCVECTKEADCARNAPDIHCFMGTNECKPCADSSHCQAPNPVCGPLHVCVPS